MCVRLCVWAFLCVSQCMFMCVFCVCACVCVSVCIACVCGLVHGRWGGVGIFSLLFPYLITLKPTPLPLLGGGPRSRTQPWRGEVLSYLCCF